MMHFYREDKIFTFANVIRHSIRVFTVCQSTCLQVSKMKQLINVSVSFVEKVNLKKMQMTKSMQIYPT